MALPCHKESEDCSIEGDFNVTECDDRVVWSYSIIEDGSLKGWTRPRSAQPLSVSTRNSAVVQTQLGIRDNSAETAGRAATAPTIFLRVYRMRSIGGIKY